MLDRLPAAGCRRYLKDDCEAHTLLTMVELLYTCSFTTSAGVALKKTCVMCAEPGAVILSMYFVLGFIIQGGRTAVMLKKTLCTNGRQNSIFSRLIVFAEP